MLDHLLPSKLRADHPERAADKPTLQVADDEASSCCHHMQACIDIWKTACWLLLTAVGGAEHRPSHVRDFDYRGACCSAVPSLCLNNECISRQSPSSVCCRPVASGHKKRLVITRPLLILGSRASSGRGSFRPFINVAPQPEATYVFDLSIICHIHVLKSVPALRRCK
jgi:hypothetical protein